MYIVNLIFTAFLLLIYTIYTVLSNLSNGQSDFIFSKGTADFNNILFVINNNTYNL